MTDRPPQLSDASIERALGRRAPRGADAALLVEVVNAAGVTPQRRAWWPPLGPARIGPRVALAWVALALAALTVGALVAGGFGRDRLDLSVIVPPLPTGSPPAGPPTTMPTPRATSTPRPEETPPLSACATAAVAVTPGGTIDPSRADAVFAGAPGVSGVFMTEDGSDFYGTPITAAVWATDGPATTKRIATVDGAAIDHVALADLSPDGRVALITVVTTSSRADGAVCASLYLVQTDGSGSTPLVRYDTLDAFPAAVFSPDGRTVAYERQPPDVYQWVTVKFDIGMVDVATQYPVEREVECGGYGPDGSLLWSPRGDRIAAGCWDSYDIFDSVRLSNVATIKAPAQAMFEAARWTDDDHMILASGGGSLDPINLVLGDARTGTGKAVGRLQPPEILAGGYSSISFSPDLHRAIVEHGEKPKVPGPRPTPGPAYLIGGRVVDGPTTSSTHPIPPARRDDVAWSRDGSTIIYVDVTGSPVLTRLDIRGDPISAASLGQLPADYSQGIWRIP